MLCTILWQDIDGTTAPCECSKMSMLPHGLDIQELVDAAVGSLYCTTYEQIAKFGSSEIDTVFKRWTLRGNRQQVDYFICYSWDDWKINEEAHLLTLRQVVMDFKKLHGRVPMFWFDKVPNPPAWLGRSSTPTTCTHQLYQMFPSTHAIHPYAQLICAN